MDDGSGVEVGGAGGRLDASQPLQQRQAAEIKPNEGPTGRPGEADDAAIEKAFINLLPQLGLHTGLDRRVLLKRSADRVGWTPEEVLEWARQRAKNELQKREHGVLNHYHQMPAERLEGVLADRALLSSNTQKALGREVRWTSQPEAVQMTRDEYDRDGRLIRPGLGGAFMEGPQMLTWVFKPSVIDMQGYDCTGLYPDLPAIPVSGETVNSVLVHSEDEVQGVRQRLEAGGLAVPVMTRDEWRQRQDRSRGDAGSVK